MPELQKRVHSVLISVYDKTGLDELVRLLTEMGIVIYSTGGTQSYIEGLGLPCVAVEQVTSYPSILGGRVKTLHPKIFGGILAMRNDDHLSQLGHFEIPMIDMVVVDLYPFEETTKTTDDHDAIIEKIDIGGISLIRAAAKNYRDVVVIPSKEYYKDLHQIVASQGLSNVSHRKKLAAAAFQISSKYDKLIYQYLNGGSNQTAELRYGENPHQKAWFKGDINEVLEVKGQKELSYNNLLDIDAALHMMNDFKEEHSACVAIFKHNNSCGLALRDSLSEAWKAALAGDPQSAFGGVIICNREVDIETAHEIDKLFYEVLIAPGFEDGVESMLLNRKNRALVKIKSWDLAPLIKKSAVNGVLIQEDNLKKLKKEDSRLVTSRAITDAEWEDLIIAVNCVKHLKSNAIALVKDKQLIGMGCGQTSRVDACEQAIEKAVRMGFDPAGSCMASEAFFPFPDCVELAHAAKIKVIAQPGGSIQDQKSIDAAELYGISMAMTGIRNFKH
ncbi:MAG TPA: bifunctional phosphoribosylaminoimidazolecarboxamide formyltransferase/IMP cyclohydrolase [Saprospiraceae bacterium]|nr:bifunctional phosphoribosylaminoimidazolecarboxamide formyltransferase/IMP cyclohydrolase [Saprospiraceae bacterium]